MTIERKTLQLADIKATGDEGEFEAIIATFDQIDSDGDIVRRGAFGSQSAPILPAHDSSSVPLGKVSRIEERGNSAIAIGRFNLEIQSAKDWFNAIKFDLSTPPALQEYSWGYRPTEWSMGEEDGEQFRELSKVDLMEVSPVLRGASVGTGTLSAKGEKGDPPPLVEQIKATTADVEALVGRIREVAEGRKEKGRKLGKDVRLAVVEQAQKVAELMDELSAVVKDEVLEGDEVQRATIEFLAEDAQRRLRDRPEA